MKVQQFKEALRSLGKLYENAGATSQQQALLEFAKLFAGHEKKTVTAFVNLVEKKKKSATATKN